MKQFSELGIKTQAKSPEGDRISIDNAIDKQIIVLSAHIGPSKFQKGNNEQCLTLQIELNNEKRVIFTNAKYLIEAMQNATKEDFPFSTIIKKTNKRFDFT